MKVLIFAMLFILLVCHTHARPWMRQLIDSTTADSNPSTNVDCVEARKISECNYNNYKLKRAVACYDSAESKLAQSQRQILFCRQCLKAVETNKLYQADSTKQTSRDNMQYLDCSQDEINIKRGIIQDAEITKRLLIDPTPFDSNILINLTIPISLDYSNYKGVNYLSPVRDQGSCASPMVFVATEIYQTKLRLTNQNFNYKLSVEAALQCSSFYAPNKRVSDCKKYIFPDTLIYYTKVGGVLEQDYPYISFNYGVNDGYRRTKGICSQQNRIFLGQAQAKLHQNLNITQIKALLYYFGPLMVIVNGNYEGFSNYNGTTVYSCPSDTQTNQIVLLYGWDQYDNWLIKNSWGSSWGYQGTMWLSSTNDCGLSQNVGYIDMSAYNDNPQVVMDPGYNSQFYNFSVMALLALLFVTFFY